MNFTDYFPVWNQLTDSQRDKISAAVFQRSVEKGTVIHNGNMNCTGLLLIQSGQLRAYILSDEGQEITLYRLFDRDICLLSASCIIQSIQFDITIKAEKNTELWIIPADVYKEIMAESAPAANDINQIMDSRFSEVMWLIEQIMWKSFDQRLSKFLLEECVLEGTSTLKITHENIANHLGTAREVVTRMLHYFQNEGMVKLTRETVEILDADSLAQLQDKK